MTVPFRVDPESVRRQTAQDPFLEFESERPSRALLNPKKDDSERTESETEPDEDTRPLFTGTSSDHVTNEHRKTSAISPSVAFAVGVAGLVTAAVGYYQMGQLLADRSQPPGATGPAPIASSVPAPVSPAPPLTGRLEIASDPAGATVKVDGAVLGVTPLTFPEYKPGNHEIVL